MSVQVVRHVNALVADLAAEHGTVDLVGRRLECEPAVRDALVDRFEAFGVLGGGGLRVRGPDGVLLVRYDGVDGWVEPGDERRPGESYSECARRALVDSVGLSADIERLEQVHLLCMDDWTDRPPVPNPYLVFEGSRTAGEVLAGHGVAETRWAASVPDDLAYEELAELSLPE